MEGQIRIIREGRFEGWWKILIDNGAECYCEQLFVEGDRTAIIKTIRLSVPTDEERKVRFITELFTNHIWSEWLLTN